MKKLSVLQNFKPSHLKISPYPYLVIQNALPENIYQELSETYPSDSFIIENNRRKKTITLEEANPNSRYQISANSILDGSVKLTPLWQDFIAFHTSDTFLHQLLEILGEQVLNKFPDFEDKMKRSLSDLRSGVRKFTDKPKDCDIAMDCQIAINTRVLTPGRVIGPHCDSPEELYAGLFYMRQPNDLSTGADLALYEWLGKPEFFNKTKIQDHLVKEFDRVPYVANTFALILNTKDSVHSVTARSVTDVSRRLVNIIGEVYPQIPEGLFETNKTEIKRSLFNWCAK